MLAAAVAYGLGAPAGLWCVDASPAKAKLSKATAKQRKPRLCGRASDVGCAAPGPRRGRDLPQGRAPLPGRRRERAADRGAQVLQAPVPAREGHGRVDAAVEAQAAARALHDRGPRGRQGGKPQGKLTTGTLRVR
jgi:hypothetical protein